MSKVWYANANGDWWSGEDADVVFVLREEDLPAEIKLEDIEGDKFERVIQTHGQVAYVEVND